VASDEVHPSFGVVQLDVALTTTSVWEVIPVDEMPFGIDDDEMRFQVAPPSLLVKGWPCRVANMDSPDAATSRSPLGVPVVGNGDPWSFTVVPSVVATTPAATEPSVVLVDTYGISNSEPFACGVPKVVRSPGNFGVTSDQVVPPSLVPRSVPPDPPVTATP
jgi:hypothetical protein